MKLLTLLLISLMSACTSVPSVTTMLTPYRIDVRQGNLVSQDMVAQLKPGLTRDQVRFLLGTPLLSDIFHGDRWDYAYRFQPGRGEPEQRHLAVFFSEGKLARVSGDVAAAAGAAETTAAPTTRMIDIPAAATSSPSPEQPAVAPAQ